MPTRPNDRHLVVHHRGARATATRGDRGWEIDLSSGQGRLDVAAGTALLGDLAAAIAGDGGGMARWRVPEATAEHHRIAAAVGFSGERRLLQMRRSLPLDRPTTITTRTFRPGIDDDEWLRVNNAAFSWHPEQSEWTTDHLAEHLAADWFDPAGFLLHPADGPIDGFCWTKVHELTPPLGEIFVIGVHPRAAGSGLGTELVVAGLEHLAGRGIESAMLYTEADNAPALRVYERLGFTTHHQVTVFCRDIEADQVEPDRG